MLQLLSTASLYVPPDLRPALEELRNQLLRDIQPVDALQTELTNALLRAACTVRRCDTAERLLAEELGLDPLLSPDPRLARIERTRTQAQRETRLAIDGLRRLQTATALRRLPAYQGLAALPAPVETATVIAAERKARGLRPHQKLEFPANPSQGSPSQGSAPERRGQAWEAWVKSQRKATTA